MKKFVFGIILGLIFLVIPVLSVSVIAECTPSWTCGSWSSFMQCGTRTCTDGCGNTKTETGTNCCIQSWTCGSWSNQDQSCGTRTCTDLNGCGTTTEKPITSTSCPIVAQCTPSWTCGSWSNPTMQCGTRTCTDVNQCNTNSGKPVASNSCPIVAQCTPSWTCGSWSNPTMQCGTRTCTDVNQCNTNSGKPVASNSCPIVQKSNVQIDNYPIVFVHGWSGDEGSFEKIEKRLKELNYNLKTLKVNTYGSSTGCDYSIADHAKELNDEISEHFPNQKINIIAHSMGGLTAKYYIENFSQNYNVNKLIMLGTPSQGADGAVALSSGAPIYGCSFKELDDLAPGSQIIQHLNNYNYNPVKLYSIFSTYDIITLPSSAKISNGDNIEINEPHCAHTSLTDPDLCSSRVFNAVIDALSDNNQQQSSSVPENTIISNPTTTKEKYCCQKFLWVFCAKWCYK